MSRTFAVAVDAAIPARALRLLDADLVDRIRLFMNAAGQHGFDGDEIVHAPETAIDQFSAGTPSARLMLLVLVSSTTEVRRVPNFMEALRKSGHEVSGSIVISAAKLSSSDVLKCLACGIGIVIDWSPSRAEFAKISHCVVSERPYFPRFDKITRTRAKMEAFIITPYPADDRFPDDGRLDVNAVYYGAIVPALKSLEIMPRLANDHVVTHDLQSDVRQDAESSDFSIVNVSLYGGRENPNVYWELGYVEGIRKPVIVIGDLSYTPPSDHRGRVTVTFETIAHLTQIIYCGLRHIREAGGHLA